MPEPVTLPLHCPECGRPVTLRFSEWTPEHPRESQTWKCPHCHAQNKADLPGKLVWVLPRQDNDPPETKPKRGESKTRH